MKAVGLIVEYNPFHNGHTYQLALAKEMSQADVAIAVMSGNFLQRGEPAIISKWQRTKMALLGGIDIVFELPYPFATQKAETFASGAVSILNAAGCDFLCFGSEDGDLLSFYKALDFMESHQKSYEEKIKKNMETGVSYPKAAALSFEELAPPGEMLDLSKPNNILGFHYLKAIKKQKSLIQPFTVKRLNADYHDETFSSAQIASATSIRKAIFSLSEQKKAIEPYVPPYTNALLAEYFQQYGLFHEWESYWPFLQFRLFQTGPKELKEIYEMEEGIESRLIKAAHESSSFQSFMQNVKTKRYTWTRLQRICTHILTNTKKSEMNFSTEKASYLRLLGMTENGKNYLNRMKAHFSLPMISKLSAYKDEAIMPDIRASQIYSCALSNQQKEAFLQLEYKQPPIYIK